MTRTSFVHPWTTWIILHSASCSETLIRLTLRQIQSHINWWLVIPKYIFLPFVQVACTTFSFIVSSPSKKCTKNICEIRLTSFSPHKFGCTCMYSGFTVQHLHVYVSTAWSAKITPWHEGQIPYQGQKKKGLKHDSYRTKGKKRLKHDSYNKVYKYVLKEESDEQK